MEGFVGRIGLLIDCHGTAFAKAVPRRDYTPRKDMVTDRRVCHALSSLARFARNDKITNKKARLSESSEALEGAAARVQIARGQQVGNLLFRVVEHFHRVA